MDERYSDKIFTFYERLDFRFSDSILLLLLFCSLFVLYILPSLWFVGNWISLFFMINSSLSWLCYNVTWNNFFDNIIASLFFFCQVDGEYLHHLKLIPLRFMLLWSSLKASILFLRLSSLSFFGSRWNILTYIQSAPLFVSCFYEVPYRVLSFLRVVFRVRGSAMYKGLWKPAFAEGGRRLW